MSKETLQFFHGTTMNHARTMERHGFGPGYLTQCVDQAWHYAECAAEAEEEAGRDSVEVVLVIEVPVKDLRVDQPSLDDPLTFF